jgi:hypothetical protein
MNKIEVTVLNALLTGFCLLSIISKANQMTLHHALQNGLIKINITSSGGHSEKCIELNVQNNGNAPLNLCLEPGVILDNLDDQQQDIVVVKTLKIKLNSKQKIDTAVYGFCCQSGNGSPQKGQKFILGKKADSLMVKLCKYIDTHNIAPDRAQNAIWVISNKHTLASLGCANDTSLAALFKICNKKNNEPLPWFYIGYSKIPGVVFSNLPCKVVLNFEYTKKTDKELTIAVYDRAGHKVKTLLANSYAAPGNKTFHFDFDIVNWEHGKYTLKVKEQEQPPLTKIFEI